MIYAPIAEIFTSIQGEGYYTGTPVVFVRFAGCKQHCSFCDTKDSWNTDKAVWMDIHSVIHNIEAKRDNKVIDRVVITGGEPFEYAEFVNKLIERLYEDFGLLCSIETSGYVGVEHAWVADILEYDAHITLSPKYSTPDDIYFDNAAEIKLLVGITDGDDLGFGFSGTQKILEQHPVDRTCDVYFQPLDYSNTGAFSDKVINRCMEKCYKYGGILSLQTHKVGGFK